MKGSALISKVLAAAICIFFVVSGFAQEESSISPAAVTKYYKTESHLKKISQWGKYKIEKGSLYSINSLVVAPDGTFFIGMTDGLDDFTRISHFTADGKFINWFGGYKNGIAEPDSLTSTQGLVCLPDYTVMVLQALRLESKQFSFDGEVLGTWPLDKTYFAMPSVATCDPEGNVYNIDVYNYLVHKYSYQGKLVWTHEAEGSGIGQSKPNSMAISDTGNLYYLDVAKNRIVVLDEQGEQESIIGKKGNNPGDFNGSSRIIIGPGGLLYILERREINQGHYDIYLKYYRQDGTFIGRLKIKSDVVQEYLWNTPQLLAVGPDGFFYLAESNSKEKFARVIKFSHVFYKPQGKTGRIVGKVSGVAPGEMKYLTVWIDAVQEGVPFYASVRPNAKGKYKITKFPIGVDYTIRVIGHNTIKYECEEITGTGAAVVKKQDLRLIEK